MTRKKWNEHIKNLYHGYIPVDHSAFSFKEGFDLGPEITRDWMRTVLTIF